jgi:hypothetical protein
LTEHWLAVAVPWAEHCEAKSWDWVVQLPPKPFSTEQCEPLPEPENAVHFA